MAAKRDQRRELNEWTKRLLGIMFLAFFGLGVLVGARMGVRWAPGWLSEQAQRMRDAAGKLLGGRSDGQAGFFAGASIALVRRGPDFYVLGVDGSLRGPAAPAPEGDVPILSGAKVELAPGRELLDYAALIVRAEAALSQPVSELRAAPDGTVRLYLAASPTEVILDAGKSAVELERAAWVMRRWHGREALIAALDVTPAHAAAVRFHTQARPSIAARASAATPSATEAAARRPAQPIGKEARR